MKFRCCLIVLICLLPQGVSAVCNRSISVAGQDLWNVHTCWPAFRDWFQTAFNLPKKHWDEGWGWNECDPSAGFPKMMNSAYLLTYGLNDGSLGPWHSNKDYYTWASGLRHKYRYEPKDKSDQVATAFDGFWRTDRVEMKCRGFDLNAASRAGNMVHESTHVIYYKWSHQTNNTWSNCANSKCSDDWLFHHLDDYKYGELEGHKHSMNQIQIEFLCDLSEFPRPWVPAILTSIAGNTANSRMRNRILQFRELGWSCGVPRPIHMPTPPGQCPADQQCCDPIPGGCLSCVPVGAACN